MTKRVFAALVIAALAAAGAAANEGAYQGTLDSPAGKLRLVLKLKKAADGAYSGSIDSLDQAAFDLPLDSVTLKDGAVQFELKRLRAGYQGKLSADGSEITGDFTQGGNPRPLAFRRFDPSKEPPPLKGAPPNEEERHFMISHLERTRDLFVKSLDGLSEAQWRFKSAPERWSIAECAEHLVLSEEFLLKRSKELFL